MSQSRVDKEARKERIRAALDVLENYVGKDGKIDATKLTHRIAELEAELAEAVQLVRDCGLSTGHADTHLDLMREVLSQVEELRKSIAELEAAIEKHKIETHANVRDFEEIDDELWSALKEGE